MFKTGIPTVVDGTPLAQALATADPLNYASMYTGGGYNYTDNLLGYSYINNIIQPSALPVQQREISMALAAMAVNEARALLQTSQESQNREFGRSRSMPATSMLPEMPLEDIPIKPFPDEDDEDTKEKTPVKRTRSVPVVSKFSSMKSRSDVKSWRKPESNATMKSHSMTMTSQKKEMTFLERFKMNKGIGYSLKVINL